METDAERWQRVKAVFSAALAADPDLRPGVLDEMCAGDRSLREEVRELLRAHDTQGPLDELGAILATPNEVPVRRPPCTRIDRYDIIEQIGEGGMGIVYKALDPRLNRLVAIKVLSPDHNEDAVRRRLLVEARAAAALDHPSIATIFEVGEADTTGVFLVMAFYEGETLAARIARGPLPPLDAARIAHDIADGLGAAHARGITHRDLKPANVLLTLSGAVKLLDFGIAKMAGVDLTMAGVVLGTAAYMAPEQMRGATVDPRADVWALGIVLHEMLTGGRLELPQHTLLTSQDGTALETDGRLPAGLERIIQRALSIRAEDRYRDGTEIRAALAAWLKEPDVVAPVGAHLPPVDVKPQADALPSADGRSSERQDESSSEMAPSEGLRAALRSSSDGEEQNARGIVQRLWSRLRRLSNR